MDPFPIGPHCTGKLFLEGAAEDVVSQLRRCLRRQGDAAENDADAPAIKPAGDGALKRLPAAVQCQVKEWIELSEQRRLDIQPLRIELPIVDEAAAPRV